MDIMASITPLITSHVMNFYSLANVRASQQSKPSPICIAASVRPEQAGCWYMRGSCTSTGSINVFVPHVSMASPWEYHDSLTVQSTRISLFPYHSRMGEVSFFPRAGIKGHFSHYSNDPVTVEKKPRWWWRFLACIYYLRPLHEAWWVCVEPTYHLHRLLKDLEFLTVPFRQAMSGLPYCHVIGCLLIAFGLVRQKKLPHFFRFHVQLCLLLDIAMQVIVQVCYLLPFSVHTGKVGVHFWTAMSFAFIFTVLECIRCALAGMYADVPLVCDAAYFACDLDL